QLVPADDPGRFNLLVDGEMKAEGVGDGGSTGSLEVTAGAHLVSEAQHNTNLSKYERVIGGDCDADGHVSVKAADTQHCTLTDTPKSRTIEVRKSLFPTSDSGKFNLLVDDAVKATNVGNNGTTGLVSVEAGQHGVSETAGTGSSLGDYTSSIDCQVAGIS